MCLTPFAYGVREHVIFQSPRPIDTSMTLRVQKPRAWQHLVEGSTVTVLPLVDDPTVAWPGGWSAATNGFDALPEVEIMCGAVNTKRPSAAAVWRQGNLLFFNFGVDPSELNFRGRDLLENSIRYIARFTEDRPIAFTPCVRTGAKVPPVRSWLDGELRARFDGERLPSFFGKKECAVYEQEGQRAFLARFLDQRGFYRPTARGKLVTDPDLETWKVANDAPELIPRCIAGLRRGGEDAERARRLLASYVPCGPSGEASGDDWSQWHEEHGPYLFFTDLGGYRWYVDSLAKARGVPSAELRGPARADPAR